MSNTPETTIDTRLITLELKWFSILAEHRGKRSEQVQVKANSTGADLIDQLSEEFPLLTRYRDHLRLAINREYTDGSRELNDGDEVAFITPVSGG